MKLIRRRTRLAGLANPGPVAAALWTDAELEAGVQLDGIVTVADARHLPRQLAAAPATHEDGSGGGGGISGPNEAQQQLAYADVVLLNKVHMRYASCKQLYRHKGQLQ